MDITEQMVDEIEALKNPLGLRDWVIDIRAGTDADVRKMAGLDSVLACTWLSTGARKAVVTVNTEADWVGYLNLEGSIKDVATHELMHVVFCDVGMSRDGKLVTSHMEDGIDRIVSIINGGNDGGHTEACSCCGTV